MLVISFALTLTCLCAGIFRMKAKSRQHQSSLLHYMLGLTLEPKFTAVTWEWTDPHAVGESMSFFLKVILFFNIVKYTDHCLKVAEHSFRVPMPRLSLLLNWLSPSAQDWQDISLKDRLSYLGNFF